jgi:hypothetical protein
MRSRTFCPWCSNPVWWQLDERVQGMAVSYWVMEEKGKCWGSWLHGCWTFLSQTLTISNLGLWKFSLTYCLQLSLYTAAGYILGSRNQVMPDPQSFFMTTKSISNMLLWCVKKEGGIVDWLCSAKKRYVQVLTPNTYEYGLLGKRVFIVMTK